MQDPAHSLRRQPALRGVIFVILVVCVATAMFLILLQTFEINGDPRSTLEKMLYGTADKPFVYRVLIPTVIRLLFETTHLNAVALALIVMYVSLLGFALAFHRLAAEFLSPTATNLATVYVLIGLYPFFYFGKIYDFAALLLYTAGLWLLIRARWRLYLALFPLAALTKETSVLLILVFAAHYYSRLGRKFFAKLLLYQVVVFAVLRTLVAWRFSANPGQALEFHLLDHFKAILNQPVFSIFFFCMLALALFIVAYKWNHKPLFLRQATLATGLPLAALFFSAGGPYEVRNLLEAYPPAFLLAIFSLRGIPEK